ncbi:hypothetical protein SFRURICE_020668 [Spodoptera frugiperda]|nr:hypothetical protein SFRURICE_020668 [Spodoptera frugiperda]
MEPPQVQSHRLSSLRHCAAIHTDVASILYGVFEEWLERRHGVLIYGLTHWLTVMYSEVPFHIEAKETPIHVDIRAIPAFSEDCPCDRHISPGFQPLTENDRMPSSLLNSHTTLLQEQACEGTNFLTLQPPRETLQASGIAGRSLATGSVDGEQRELAV